MMTDPTPRPCYHTSLAIVGVLLAGLMLGAFSPQTNAPANAPDSPTTHASVKLSAGR